MKQIKYFCDKCKKEKNERDLISLGTQNLFVHIDSNKWNDQVYHFELCKECFDEFLKCTGKEHRYD